MKQKLHVMVGILIQDRKILLAKRPNHKHLGGYWEFPGGKCELGEEPKVALTRELEEELAITVIQANPFHWLQYEYPAKVVTLDVWKISEFQGTPIGNEGQEIKWVEINDLPNWRLPEANKEIVEKLL